jgi:biopolymer transport protein ExbD
LRYPRTAKVFHGQIDAAPIAGVFFLLVLFLLLHSSLVFTPGIKIDLNDYDTLIAKRTGVRMVKIDRKGSFLYNGKALKESAFYETIHEERSKPMPPTTFIVETDPLTKPEILARLKTSATEMGIVVKPPGTRLDLPEADDLPGTANPTVVVSVNLNGQMFYENQIIKEDSLLAKLSAAREQAGPALTLVIQPDRELPVEVIVKLNKIAMEAKIGWIILGTRAVVQPNGQNGNSR